MDSKIVVIGLDGLHLDLIQPWIDEGKLPTFKKIIDHGVSGKLKSVIPPLTPTAWSSFATGKNPGKHGVYYFTVRDPETGQHTPINATQLSGKTVWEILGDSGKKVLVINMPITYPPKKVNGVLISGFMTPSGKKDFSYPQSVISEIENRFGEYFLYIKTPLFSANLSKDNVEYFLKELHEEVEYKFNVTHYLLDNYDADFTCLHIWGTDRIQHELWNIIDSNHPRYEREMAAECSEQIIDYFSKIDAEIDRLMKRMDDDTSIFIMSDHGFGPIHRLIDLNAWLLREGYIKIKKNPLSQLRLNLWKMGLNPNVLTKFKLSIARNSKSTRTKAMKKVGTGPYDGIKSAIEKKHILLSMKDIDWSKTKAFSMPGLVIGVIMINLEGRQENGCVKPGKEYEDIRREIVEKLRALRDEGMNQAIGGDVYTGEEIYSGDHLDNAPDIVFLSMENKYMPTNFWHFISRKCVIDNMAWFGNHVMDGIMLGKGKYISPGQRIEGANIMDLAPTFLHLMGNPIPSDMDGKVLKNIFTEEFLTENEVEFTDDVSYDEREPKALSKEEEEELLKRLKSWGYLQ